METKRCLFCEQMVPSTRLGDDLRFENCYCAPGGYYRLRQEFYTNSQDAGYRVKTELFPLLSGYIRERTEYNDEVALSRESIESLLRSPHMPSTIDEKAKRLLRYLYRKAEGPDTPVFIHRLSERYNLTYSPNLQEFIYIVEKLKEEGSIERIGSSFKLTEAGWIEAARVEGESGSKRCAVLLPQDENLRQAWIEDVFPIIEQSGYSPCIETTEDGKQQHDDSVSFVDSAKLVIADLSSASSDVFYAAGYALGVRIPIIWTAKHGEVDNLVVPSNKIRPILWEETGDLASKLHHKLVTSRVLKG